jgi:type VI secretion system secreted protein VgrG
MQTLPANIERFTFEASGSSEELHVVSFGVTEGISQLFSIDLELVAEDNELDFEQFIGKAGVLSIQQYIEEDPRYLHGVISSFKQENSGLRLTTYHATVVPKIWYLMHRHNCRIFQQMSVKDIVQKILKELGVPGDEYRFSLQNEPPKREYCVQYRESEFDFISRLLEEEGIFYFFKHEKDKHTLIMGDGSSAHFPIPGESKVMFHEPRPGQVADEVHIYRFKYTEKIFSGKVSLKDYNFKKPALNLKGEKIAEKDKELEVYDYPGKFEDPGRGKNLAKIRLEEYQAVKKVGSGATTATNFAAGFFYTMEEYPRKDFNKKYLITQHQLSGSQPQVLEEGAGESGTSFSSSFECIPFEVPYRPDRVTHKPVVEGNQTAIVVGPKGEEIYTDEHGRIKVQFHWDREGKMDEKSSCWIRVSQVWAGTTWGAMYIPRIGQEVIVDFLEGDPDRPIITGRVYHGTNKPPYPLPAEKTKSTIKSNSSKGGGGFNELRFEDRKDQEEVYLQAEKDWNSLVKNNRSATIGGHDNLAVAANRTQVVGANQTNTVALNRTTTIVSGNDILNVGSSIVKTVGATETITIKGESGDSKCEKEKPDKNILKGAAVGAAIGMGVFGALGALAGAAAGAVFAGFNKAKENKGSVARNTTIVKGDDVLTLQDGSSKVEIAKGDSFANSPKGLNQITSKDIKIVATNSILMQCGQGSIAIDAAGNIKISGPQISVGGKALIDIKAPLVKINS